MRAKLNWLAAAGALAAMLGLSVMPALATVAPPPTMAAQMQKKTNKKQTKTKKTWGKKKTKTMKPGTPHLF